MDGWMDGWTEGARPTTDFAIFIPNRNGICDLLGVIGLPNFRYAAEDL